MELRTLFAPFAPGNELSPKCFGERMAVPVWVPARLDRFFASRCSAAAVFLCISVFLSGPINRCLQRLCRSANAHRKQNNDLPPIPAPTVPVLAANPRLLVQKNE